MNATTSPRCEKVLSNDEAGQGDLNVEGKERERESARGLFEALLKLAWPVCACVRSFSSAHSNEMF